MQELAMIDDRLMPLDQAQVSALDRGLHFGDGVYEVIRCCDGRLFALEEHLSRLAYSLEQLGMERAVNLDLIRERLMRMLSESAADDATFYLQITRGTGRRALEFDASLTPTFLMTVQHQVRRGVETCKAISLPDQRWGRCDIKSLNLLPNVMARRAALDAGAHDALFVDTLGYVTESSSSSVMMIQGKVLRTAPLTANILASVTRALVLRWAPEMGLSVHESAFTVAQAQQADELFLCGTTTEILPIIELDGKPLFKAQPGPWAQRLQQRLVEAMQKSE